MIYKGVSCFLSNAYILGMAYYAHLGELTSISPEIMGKQYFFLMISGGIEVNLICLNVLNIRSQIWKRSVMICTDLQ